MMERFTTDYDLPNDSNYSESCASIGLAMFCRRMAQITGDASYLDTMELALANTVLAGIAMDGKSFFYVNPLEVWPDNCMEATSMAHVKATRQKWFGCACCPPNIARTLASLGEYICFVDEDGFYLNLHTGASFECDTKSGRLAVEVDTEFPWKGHTIIRIKSDNAYGKARIRIPSYANNLCVNFNGEKLEQVIEKGYLVIEGKFKDEVIDITFDMPAQIVYANPNVRADIGKVAVVKGPIVYCLEEIDNGSNLAGVYIDVTEALEEEYCPDVLGGVTVIKAKGKRVETASWDDGKLYAPRPVKFEKTNLTFVPYCNWGNRGYGEMSVWVKSL